MQNIVLFTLLMTFSSQLFASDSLVEIHASLCEKSQAQLIKKIKSDSVKDLEVSYFETKSLELLSNGLIIRLRKKSPSKKYLTVKLRGIKRPYKSKGLNCEFDQYSNRQTYSCKIKKKLTNKEAASLLNNPDTLKDYLTNEQKYWLNQHIDLEEMYKDFKTFGAVKIKRHNISQKLKQEPWRLEIWNFSNKDWISEISLRAKTSELPQAIKALTKYLNENNLTRCSEDIRKTNYTLNYFN